MLVADTGVFLNSSSRVMSIESDLLAFAGGRHSVFVGASVPPTRVPIITIRVGRRKFFSVIVG